MENEWTIDDFLNSKNTGKKPKLKKKKEKKGKKDDGKFKTVINAIRQRKNSDDSDSYDYPPKYKVMTIVRSLIWLTVLVLIGKGIMAVVFPPKPIIQRVEYVQSPSESDAAKTFAVNFVRDYLTYDSNDQSDQSDYKKKLVRYTTNILTETRSGWSKVIEANVWNTKKIDDNASVVTVYAKVQQGRTVSDQGESKDVYVRVPVLAYDEEHLLVRSYPAFTAPYETIQDHYQSYSGSPVSDKIDTQIKDTLDNFFKIYDKGTPEQLAYFMKNPNVIKGYEGEYSYNALESLQAYDLNKQETQVLVLVQISVKDSAGSVFNQSFNYVMVKDEKDSRWYIERSVDVGKDF